LRFSRRNMSKEMIKIRIGTVGLGLMGSSIATCILAAGHEVTSLVKDLSIVDEARQRILSFLEQLHQEGILSERPEEVLKRHTITDDVTKMAGHEVVIESIIENVDEKKSVYKKARNGAFAYGHYW
jgi:3-hydroxybutyryl-CoA dehydrogenase